MKGLVILSFGLAVLATPVPVQTAKAETPLGFNGHVFDPLPPQGYAMPSYQTPHVTKPRARHVRRHSAS